MKAVLKQEFRMNKADIEEYNNLPDNMPDIKLTAKQVDLVDRLYRKYIGGKITVSWGTELFEIELKEKWPSGPRVKRHEAKRFILNNLVSHQDSKVISSIKAMQMFWAGLTCRYSYAKLLQEIYDIK